MEMYDLTLPWDDDCPSFLGYPNPKTYYIFRRHEDAVNAQMLEIPNHNGTHLDSERHMDSNGRTVGNIPLEQLVGPAAVVDVSDEVDDYGIYTKEDILDQPVDVHEGDIVIIHTGYHRFAYNQPEADIRRYFLKHPGPDASVAEWADDMDLDLIATDTAGMDHPMNGGGVSRSDYPEIVEGFEEAHGADVEEVFPPETEFCMHMKEAEGLIHAEHINGEIDQLLNQRTTIGVFPWRMTDVEASPCRVVAFEGLG